MAKRKQNVVVEEIDTNPKCVAVYIDDGMLENVESIEGVLSISETGKSRYAVHLDPRYDKQEIISEINALNKDSDIPDVWKGA